jgi:hypothetical protein
MSEHCIVKSNISQCEYDLFSCVKIVNIQQACAYMENGIYPVDVKSSIDNKTNKRCVVFYFDKNESKEVYDKWCNYEL